MKISKTASVGLMVVGALTLPVSACDWLDANGQVILSVPPSAPTCGAGGTGVRGAGGSAGSSGTGADNFCGLGGPPATWTYLEPEVSSQPMPTGAGGIIVPGTYRLTRFVEHGDTSACLTSSGTPRYQVLTLGKDSGTLVNEDNHFLHWPLTFTYATTGPCIVTQTTCTPYGVGGVNHPFGPFGPFDTFSASGNQVELFSPTCHYRATYTRVTTAP